VATGNRTLPLQHPSPPARHDEEHAEHRDGDAEPLERLEPLAQIEAGAQRHHHRRRRLEDDRVAGGRVVDRDVRELGGAPDAGDAQDEEGPKRVGAQPARRVRARASQQNHEEA